MNTFIAVVLGINLFISAIIFFRIHFIMLNVKKEKYSDEESGKI